MHETGLVRDLVRRVEQAARDAGARRVVGVTVRLGALCMFSPAHFRAHFVEEVRGTMADGATLAIETAQDVADPHAQDVMIRAIDLDLPEVPG